VTVKQIDGALLATGKPADAERDFQAALGLGETGVAHLGMGSADFARQQWDAAARDFAAAWTKVMNLDRFDVSPSRRTGGVESAELSVSV